MRLANFSPLLVRLILGGLFIYAGLVKVAGPIRFVTDINNYRMLPWALVIALAFYLPWLEVFAGVALLGRFCYRGALALLLVISAMFVFASIVAKLRGLDVSCGCFGHAAGNLKFGWHLILDLLLLSAVAFLWWRDRVDYTEVRQVS